MSTEEIKSGSEVISDFLASLKDKKEIDPSTLDAVQALFETKKLSKAQLLRTLEASRVQQISQLSEPVNKNGSGS